MNEWKIEYIKEAVDDLKKLDHSVQIQVLKAIRKTAQNPLPTTEGGLGKPLGNHTMSKLSGYCKIKLRKTGIRVVYRTIKQDGIMKIIIISVRDDETVYKLAEQRIH